jgi:hypothetical protein
MCLAELEIRYTTFSIRVNVPQQPVALVLQHDIVLRIMIIQVRTLGADR